MNVPRDKNETRKLPMMPIRDMVIFPYMMTPFVVGRESSVRALEEALNGDRKIFLATQHDASIDEPRAKDIFQVGSITATLCRASKCPMAISKSLSKAWSAPKSIEVNDRDGFSVATVRTGKSNFANDACNRANVDAARDLALRAIRQGFQPIAQLRNTSSSPPCAWMSRPNSPTPSRPISKSALKRSRNFSPSLIHIDAPRAHRRCTRRRESKNSTSIATSSRAREAPDGARAEREYYLNEKNQRPSRKSWAAARRASSTSCAKRLTAQACPRMCSKRRSRNSRSLRPCRRCRQLIDRRLSR